MRLTQRATAWSLALACLLSPSLAAGQEKKIAAPAGTVPLSGIAYGEAGDIARLVSPAFPFPVWCVTGCGGGGGGGDAGGADGFVEIPASGSAALATPTKGVLVTAAGSLGLELADGTNNNSQLLPVVAGQVFPFHAVRRSAGNTAGVLGLK